MNDLLTQVVGFLSKYGYLEDSDHLTSLDDNRLKSAIAAYQRMDANVERIKNEAGSELLADGVLGPSTLYAMTLPRCECPDVALPAMGSAGWKGCHGGANIHKALVRVSEKNLPSFLRPEFTEVLRRVRDAYAKLGLLFVFVNSSNGKDYLGSERITSNANIEFSFTRGDGWIGLAIVGNPSIQRCDSNIWCRYEYRYQPSNIVSEWTTLIKHELGHNCGLGHSRGGVMNPSLVPGLPPEWARNDPSYSTLVRWFSGEPIDLGGSPEPPTPPDNDDPKIGEPIGDAFRMHDGIKARLFRVFG